MNEIKLTLKHISILLGLFILAFTFNTTLVKADEVNQLPANDQSYQENSSTEEPTSDPNISQNAIKKTTPKLLYRLKNLHHTVVQKSVIKSGYIYSLQEVGKDTYIRRAKKPRKGTTVKFSPKHELRLKNFGHTQTWLSAGKNKWLVGTHPVKDQGFYWDTEVALVKFPKKRKTISKMNKLPHLVHLNFATDMNQSKYPGLRRSEVAISPNHKLFLIASVDRNNNGHFALYKFNEVLKKLSKAAKHKNKAVNVRKLHQIAAFHVDNMFGCNANQLNSIQGYDIANDKTIYISRERAPLTKKSSLPREIVKIPWGNTDTAQWNHYNVTHPSWKKVATELEGIELASSKVRLTVSYHKQNKRHTILGSRIYKLSIA